MAVPMLNLLSSFWLMSEKSGGGVMEGRRGVGLWASNISADILAQQLTSELCMYVSSI